MTTTIDFAAIDLTQPDQVPSPEPPYQKSGLVCWSYDSEGSIQSILVKRIGENQGFRGGARTRAVFLNPASPVALQILAPDRTWIRALDINMNPLGADQILEGDSDNLQNVSMSGANLQGLELECDGEVLIAKIVW